MAALRPCVVAELASHRRRSARTRRRGRARPSWWRGPRARQVSDRLSPAWTAVTSFALGAGQPVEVRDDRGLRRTVGEAVAQDLRTSPPPTGSGARDRPLPVDNVGQRARRCRRGDRERGIRPTSPETSTAAPVSAVARDARGHALATGVGRLRQRRVVEELVGVARSRSMPTSGPRRVAATRCCAGSRPRSGRRRRTCRRSASMHEVSGRRRQRPRHVGLARSSTPKAAGTSRHGRRRCARPRLSSAVRPISFEIGRVRRHLHGRDVRVAAGVAPPSMAARSAAAAERSRAAPAEAEGRGGRHP